MARRPVTFVSSTQADALASPATTITINTPASVLPGDLMLAFIVRNRDEHDGIVPGFSTLTGTSPAVWQIPDSRGDSAPYADGGNPSPGWATRFCMAWRVVVAGEGASHTFTATATPDNIRAGVIVAYRYVSVQWDDNAETYAPATFTSMVAAATTTSIPNITDGRLITVSSRGGGVTMPGTVRAQASGSSGATTCYVSVSDELVTTAGSTGGRTVSGGSVGPSPEVTRNFFLTPENHPATLMQ